MKRSASIVVPVIALLGFASSHVSARATIASHTVTADTADAADESQDAVVKGAKTATKKTKEGLSKTGEVMTDAWITSRIHARFVDEDLLKDSDITVDTEQHVVTLKGTVTGRAGRARATTVAKQTEGVHRVVNRLTVGPKPKG